MHETHVVRMSVVSLSLSFSRIRPNSSPHQFWFFIFLFVVFFSFSVAFFLGCLRALLRTHINLIPSFVEQHESYADLFKIKFEFGVDTNIKYIRNFTFLTVACIVYACVCVGVSFMLTIEVKKSRWEGLISFYAMVADSVETTILYDASAFRLWTKH